MLLETVLCHHEYRQTVKTGPHQKYRVCTRPSTPPPPHPDTKPPLGPKWKESQIVCVCVLFALQRFVVDNSTGRQAESCVYGWNMRGNAGWGAFLKSSVYMCLNKEVCIVYMCVPA